MMPVILASLGGGMFVGGIGMRIEHRGPRAVAGDPFALQIGDVLGERRRTEARPLMTDDARLHHHPTRSSAQRQGERRAPASAEARAAGAGLATPKAFADMAGPLCGPHNLAHEALRTLHALVAVPDAAGPNMDVVVVRAHGIDRSQESG